MGNKLLATDPRPTPQGVVVERVVEQLGLIEPRGMRRGRAGPPPSSASLEIGSRRRGTMAGAASVDQEHASEPAMPLPEPPQLLDVVRGIVGSQAHGLHPPAGDDQEVKEIDGALPGVLELPLLDRSGDRPADRTSLQDLAIGHLVGADDPDAPPGPSRRVGVAPEDLLGPLLEPGVPPGGPPVPCAMRLQIDLVQDPADGPGTDGRDDSVGDGLIRQVLARPMSDVEAPGHRCQAGQFDDLRPLQGGQSRADGPDARGGRADPATRMVQNADTSVGWYPRRTASSRPRPWSVPRRRWPARSGHVGPDTRAKIGCGRSAEGSVHHDRPLDSAGHERSRPGTPRSPATGPGAAGTTKSPGAA